MRIALASMFEKREKLSGLFLAVFLCSRLLLAQNPPSGVVHTHDILEVRFSPDGTKLMSYSAGDGWLALWDVQSGQLVWRAKTEFIQKGDEYYTLGSFSFSRSQQLLASGSGNGTLQLWDATTGRLVWRADAHQDSVSTVAISPDAQMIASAATPKEGENEIAILGGKDGRVIKKLTGLPCAVVAINFDEAGKRLQTGDLDGGVSKWDLATGERLAQKAPRPCRGRRPYEWEISFSSDLKLAVMRTGETEVTMRETQKSAAEVKAVWLRLHNDAALPIKIPTQSVYLPNPKCYYTFANGKKIYSLCDGREISIWHGLENTQGVMIPYGFDFGSEAIVAPKTSVLFAAPREILRDHQAIRFNYRFLKESENGKIEEYGKEMTLRFEEAK